MVARRILCGAFHAGMGGGIMDMHQNGSAAGFEVSVSPITLYSVLTDGGYWGSGQVAYAVLVRRDNSFNTLLPGVFLDKLSGPPTRYERVRSPWLGSTVASWPAPPAARPNGEIPDVATELCQALNAAQGAPG